MDKNIYETFWDKAKKLNEIVPFEPCSKCNNKLLVTKLIEPVDSSYFKNNTPQKCIVECSQCKTEYLSNYD